MKTVKTCELIGPALDWAVAKADGVSTHKFREKTFALFGSLAIPLGDAENGYAPSTCWHCGGPLIHAHAIGFVGHDADNWLAFSSPEDETHEGIGPTHLVAACRAIVAAKLGDTVQIPDELWTAQNDTAPTSRPDSEDVGATN